MGEFGLPTSVIIGSSTLPVETLYGRVAFIVMDTVPLPVASVSPVKVSFGLTCVPSTIPVMADDPSVTTSTVAPPLLANVRHRPTGTVARVVARVYSACSKKALRTVAGAAGTSVRTTTPEVGTYFMPVGAPAGPSILVCATYGEHLLCVE